MNYTWTKIFGSLGFVWGLISAGRTGTEAFIEYIGFSLPYTIVCLIIGLVIDIFLNRK